jgi:hypothetical protein
MHRRVPILLLLVFLNGCSGPDGKRFSIQFQPFSSALDPRAQADIQAAAAFANTHPLMPLSIRGFAIPPDSGDVDTLRQQRVMLVRNELVRDGVSNIRIELLGNGILYPGGVPDLPPDRIDINIGL